LTGPGRLYIRQGGTLVRVRGQILGILALAGATLTLPGPALAAVRGRVRQGPAGIAFYRPPDKLRGSGHGGVIWARTQTGPAALAGAARNELVLYRSISANGRAVAVSGTVSVPPGRPPNGGWPVITWDHGTTGIADVCAPSRDSLGDPAHIYIDYIYPLLGRWLQAGWAVLRTDYEGLGTPGIHPYLDGVSEAHSTLDMVRAARRLVPALGSRVIIAGHSQGGQAALWAAALAAKWTPELHVRGTVAFAPVSHLAVQADDVHSVSTTSLSGDVSLILRGIDTADAALHVGGLLTPQAAALYPQTLTRCLPQLGQPDSFGSLPASSFFGSDADLAPVIAALGARMDPDRLRIRTPVLIEQGGADGTVFPVFTQQLDQELAGLGDPITLHSYPGVTHGGIVVAGASDATSFVAAQLAH
jgi:pimeloyl-ACP methyl ester carboxylesterase